MKSLKEAIQAADRQVVIADMVKLIDSEVKSKSGLSGMAIKTGYKVVKKLKGGRMIEKASGMLLDPFTDAIEPIHAEFRETGASSGFASFLQSNSDRACDALLGITDRKAQDAENPVLRKTYSKLRPQAVKHVKDALPGVGRLADKYTV